VLLIHVFHRKAPAIWANARLARYADDVVVLADHQSEVLKEWLESRLEDRLGLTVNRSKTSVVEVGQGEALDFLGYTFRYDRDTTLR